MLASRQVEIGEDEDAGSLTARLSELGAPLLAEVLEDLAAGRLQPVAQPQGGLRAPPRSPPTTGQLDLAAGVASPGRCGRCRPTWARRWRSAASRSRSGPRAPGEAAAPLAAEGRLVAATGRSLELLRLQPPGKGRMDAASFLRGWRGPSTSGRPMAQAVADRIALERTVALRVLPRVDGGPYAGRRAWPPGPAGPASTRGPAPRRPGWPTARCSAAAPRLAHRRRAGPARRAGARGARHPADRRLRARLLGRRAPLAPRSTRPCARPARSAGRKARAPRGRGSARSAAAAC